MFALFHGGDATIIVPLFLGMIAGLAYLVFLVISYLVKK